MAFPFDNEDEDIEETENEDILSDNDDEDLEIDSDYEIDFENRISRKHLMIYRDEDQFYVRNLSSKNTVHVNETLLSENESMVLNDKDKIILSNFIECEFEKAPQEGELINNVG